MYFNTLNTYKICICRILCYTILRVLCRLRGSHHMTSHQEWFRDLRTPDRPGYIETWDDVIHPIRHLGNVPFGKDGKNNCIKNVLHVPTITMNFVSVSQIVEQGMQVRFNNKGWFIEKHGRIIAGGWREYRMFSLNSNEVKSTMYATGLKIERNIELSHKRTGNICRIPMYNGRIHTILFECPSSDHLCK